MPEAVLNNVVEWTVSELSAALRKTVEDNYGYVRVRGEVSGFKGASPSGHCYFRLKDDKAVLEGVIWKGNFAPHAGQARGGARSDRVPASSRPLPARRNIRS